MVQEEHHVSLVAVAALGALGTWAGLDCQAALGDLDSQVAGGAQDALLHVVEVRYELVLLTGSVALCFVQAFDHKGCAQLVVLVVAAGVAARDAFGGAVHEFAGSLDK